MPSSPTRFNFFTDQDISVPIVYPSPVQTVSGGSDWLYEDYNDTPLLDISDTHAAAIKADGTLWVWGINSAGYLGDGTYVSRSSPVQTISGGTNWKSVSFGDSNIAAIKTDGTLWMWGYGFSGQLGNGVLYANQISPVQTVSQGTNWKQVSPNLDFTGAIKTDGTLWVWGRNVLGSLGINCGGVSVNIPSPVQTISGGNNWKCISTGCQFSAAIKTDGTLWVWGSNNHGKLGTNDVIEYSSPVQTISQDTNWKQVSLGYIHAAAIKTDGTLWSWGRSVAGQLGNNSSLFARSSPVQTISTGTNWTNVQAGTNVSSGLKTDGTLWLWGSGICGLLGDNTVSLKSSPVQTVSTGTNWKQIRLGTSRVISTKNDGTLWTWGDQADGILGTNSTTACRSSPVQTVSTGANWTEECAWCSFSKGSLHTAAIKTDGTLWLWGCSTSGRLGNNNTSISRSSPVQTVSQGTNWKQVSAGSNFTSAIKTDGTLWTWGCGNYLALGNNSFSNVSCPIQTISQGNNWKQVSSGVRSTAAIKTDGTLWLWGTGRYGKLGNNSTINCGSPVQTVSTGTNWKQVSADYRGTAAIKIDGTLWLWGATLADNSTIHRSSPVQTVSTGTNWKQVSINYSASGAAIKTDGTLWLWGGTNRGTLGNNSTITHSSPVQTVSTGTNWKQVSLARYHTGAIKTDGTLWMWGCGAYSSLGNGNTINHSSPVQTVSNTTNWKQVSLDKSSSDSIALNNDNELFGWGINSCGSLAVDTQLKILCRKQTDFDDVFVRRDIFSESGLWLWGSCGRGRLGNFSTNVESSPVQTISGGTNWKQISATYFNSAGIKTDGTLWLWGYGSGNIGANTPYSNRSSPIQTVSRGTDWRQVSLSRCNSAAVKTDGTLWLWGCNNYGNVGDNTSINRSSPVQTISTGTNWRQVSLGCRHSAAIKTDGTLWLWGNGTFGKLGNNSELTYSSPVQTISTGTDWKEVCATHCTTAAIKYDGTLWLWGYNNRGNLGTNSTILQSSPVQTVSTGTNWKQVSAAACHTAGIKTDGTLWMWGYNRFGILGVNNSSIVHISSPIQTVSTGTNWKQVSLACQHSAAIKTDGTLWVWGSNTLGRLGNNNTIDQSSPIQTITSGTNWKQVSAGDVGTVSLREDCW